MLTPEILDAIDRSVLCWLATADANGVPNVSPKEAFAAHDERSLLIAQIASPQSVRNIEVNPNVCVSFVDVFVQKGFKLTGTADLVMPGTPRFEALLPPLHRITKGLFPIHGIIAIDVTATAPIVAPSYFLYPDVTEAEQRAAAMRTYGVAPLPPAMVSADHV
ncbi:MAG: pyridoxamine 5'-phosphate oxidase family protein [Bacteroidota bacterium]